MFIASKFLFDLGIRKLSKDWKELFTTKYLREDFFAGLNVAAVALPLSLAVGMATSVEAELGLVTAVVASIAVALFGGTPLAISGPAAAMSVLLATVVQQHGVGGLLVVGLSCGVLQVLTGIFRLGQLIHFVPLPVVSGFVAGIGALLLIGQIPSALGLPAPAQSKIFDLLTHIADVVHQARWESVGLAIGTVAIIFGFSKISKKIPAPLIAVVVCSLLANFLGFQVDMIGEPMESLFRLRIPSLNVYNFDNSSGNVLPAVLIVYFLASLETLLSSASVDRLSKKKRHNPDQELIGQGIGNVLVSFFGGIPATGVFYRSALNVKSGAKTRRSAIIHAIVLLLSIFFCLSWIAHIPVAVLTGMLIVVSFRMLQPKELIELWRTSRVDAGVYIVTFISIVGIDLAAGIQTGIVLALVIAAVSLSRVKALIQLNGGEGPVLVSIDGPLTFMASSKNDMVREQLSQADLSNGLLLDLSEVTAVDTTGVSYLIETLKGVLAGGHKVAIKGASAKFRKMLMVLDPSGDISSCLVFSETEIMEILEVGDVRQSKARLKFGVERFRKVYRPNYLSLLKKLAVGQNPHTLYITCSDSRINPNLITATDPGELFIVRNVGNIVPPFGADNMPAEGAAIEYAIGVLGVKDIVVCGHSECGAMNAVYTGQIFENESSQKLPSVARWLHHLKDLRSELPKHVTLNQMAQYNIIKQLDNLKTYPIIKERIDKKDVRVHAWFYDLALADIHEWNPETNLFTPLGRLETGEVSNSPVQ